MRPGHRLLSIFFLTLLLANSGFTEEQAPFKPEICHPPTKQNYPQMTDPISDTSGAECAGNTTEMREKFPNTVEKLYRLEGNWTDANFRKRVTPIPKNKQVRDSKGNWIVNDIDNTTITYRFNANKQGMWIQETSESKKGKFQHSNISPLQICKKGDSMFLRVNKVEIPVAFPGKRCMWIGANGKWWRFWRFQDIHFSFIPPTDDPNAALIPPPTPSPTTENNDFLPGPIMDLFKNGVR